MPVIQSQDTIDFTNSTLDEKIDIIFKLLIGKETWCILHVKTLIFILMLKLFYTLLYQSAIRTLLWCW